MKFFIRFRKLPDSYCIINAQHLPKAIEECKQYRPDCIVSRMDDVTITPNIFIKLKIEIKSLDFIGIKNVYHLLKPGANKEAEVEMIECLPKDLERLACERVGEKNGKIYSNIPGYQGTPLLIKNIKGKPIPLCIIVDKGPKKELTLLK